MNAADKYRLALERACADMAKDIIATMKSEGLTGVGFTITFSDFGDQGMFAYASNINRQDVIRLFREAISKLEASA